MIEIQLRRSTVLADCDASNHEVIVHGEVVPIVRTGLSVSPTVSLVEPTSTDDTIKALDSALAIFRKDVALDACSVAYTDECKGTDADVDQVTKCIKALHEASKTVDAKSCLECAGVEPTAVNIQRFADCVKVREDQFSKVPTGTLAWCAVAVRRNLSKGAMSAHSTDDYRSRLETWSRQYAIKRDQWANGTWGEVGVKDATLGPGMDQVQPWVDRYNAFRSEFIKNGGKTNAPYIRTNAGWPWWAWALIGTGILVVGTFVLVAPTLIARRMVP